MHDICVKNKVGIFVILFIVLFLFYKISIRIEKQMPIRMNHQLKWNDSAIYRYFKRKIDYLAIRIGFGFWL